MFLSIIIRKNPGCITNSSDGFTNLEFRIYFLTNICNDLFINLQTEKKTARFSFTMAQTEINLWTRIVKQIAENIWWIHYLVQVSFNCIKNFQFLLSSSSSNRLHWISLLYKEKSILQINCTYCLEPGCNRGAIGMQEIAAFRTPDGFMLKKNDTEQCIWTPSCSWINWDSWKYWKGRRNSNA